MDGWVIVGTKLDSKQLEKDLKNAERRLQQYEKEAEKLTKAKAKAEIDLQPYEEQKRIIQETTDEALKYAQSEQEVKKQLEIEKVQLNELNQKYSKQLLNLESINNKIKENTKNQSLMKNQIEKTRKKTSDLNIDLNKVSKSTSNTIKKVAKWALAIFGVRSAYMFVRQAASTLAQYNEKIGADLEYIRFALASTLQPIIEGLIQLVYKLLTYVNYIAKAWFGVDLFANASAKAMNKGAKSAEKMKKSLAGFDEMNVLNDNGTTGAMGATAPSIDLSQWQGEVPSWIQWIADNKDIVIAGLLGIAGGLIAVSFGFSAIKGFGIGIALAGIISAIKSLIKFLKDPTFENFTDIIIGIGLAILGVGIIIGNFPLIIAGAIAVIVGLVIKNYDFIVGLFDKLINWFEKDFVNALYNLFGPLGNIIAQPFIDFVNSSKGLFEGLFGGIKKVVKGIVQLFKGDFKNGIKNVFIGLKDIMLAPINALISGINSLIRGVNKIKFNVPDWIPGIGGKKWGFNIPQIPKLAVGGIVNMPGRGIDYGGANIAERGAEAVIPLTNSQSLDMIADAIGKRIVINANITNTMNGRVISKELKRINNDNDFAFNR